MRHIPLTSGGLHEAAVARAVERVPRIAGRAEQRIAGHLLVRAGDRPGARNRLGVVDEGAALGACQVIPAVPLEKMRAFDLAERSPAEDARPRPDQLPRLDVVFLHHDAVELVLPGSVVPGHLDVPLPPGTGDVAVIVVEQRSVKTHAIQVDRLGPWAVDRRAGHQEVLNVLERARPAADVGVDQPEQAVGVGQAWRPDAAGTRIAAHVQLRRTGQGVTDLLPVDQVLAGQVSVLMGALPPLAAVMVAIEKVEQVKRSVVKEGHAVAGPGVPAARLPILCGSGPGAEHREVAARDFRGGAGQAGDLLVP